LKTQPTHTSLNQLRKDHSDGALAGKIDLHG
jgi:hypothetical protein